MAQSDLILKVVFLFGLAFILLLAVFVLTYGRGGSTRAGLDQAFLAKDIYKSIPRIREIVNMSPRNKLWEEAETFLIDWQRMQRSIRRMGRERRQKFLADLYYTRVEPILKAHQDLQKQRRNKK